MFYIDDLLAEIGIPLDGEDPCPDLLLAETIVSHLGGTLHENPNSSAPKPTQWKDQKNDDIFVSTDKGRRIALEQAKREINHVKKKLVDLGIYSAPDEPVDPDSIVDGLFKEFLGETSKIYCTFLANRDISFANDHVTFSRFLLTFLSTTTFGLSREQIAEDSQLNDDGLMSVEIYKRCWKSIGDANMPEDLENDSGITPFWYEVEVAINHTLKYILIVDMNGRIVAVIDDDKMHYQL
mmetsp:Transcript_13971/g.20949  ORF Transcript_13971/g.20949 Transcript_13971/m.20949 type:complete len:238 (+) Transcript_13971:430-1143(+)